jgi:hypothetical protein
MHAGRIARLAGAFPALGVLLVSLHTLACGRDTTTTETLDSGVTVRHSASGCVSFELSAAAFACRTDADCDLIQVDENACPGASVCCANTALNQAAASDVSRRLGPLLTGVACPCGDIDQQPACVGGACTIVHPSRDAGDDGGRE